MENFESDFENNTYFDEIAQAISGTNEANVEICEDYTTDVIELNCDIYSAADLIDGISDVFEKNAMNEHLATIDLLGDLGYTDMLMYYCVVMDCVFMKNELENHEDATEIITPAQYITETETDEGKTFNYEVEVSKADRAKLIKVLNYLKNKEFKILSNTFYMDGSDFIIFLSLKSVVGYNLRIKIVFRCDPLDNLDELEENLKKIQRKQIEGEEG